MPSRMTKSGSFLHLPYQQFFLIFILKLGKNVVLSCTLFQRAKARYLGNLLEKKPSDFFCQEALGRENSGSLVLTFSFPDSPPEEYCLLSNLVTGFT